MTARSSSCSLISSMLISSNPIIKISWLILKLFKISNIFQIHYVMFVTFQKSKAVNAYLKYKKNTLLSSSKLGTQTVSLTYGWYFFGQIDFAFHLTVLISPLWFCSINKFDTSDQSRKRKKNWKTIFHS
jgi:hypothetical protein